MSADLLRDPRVRLAAGLGALVAAGFAIDGDRVGPMERHVFRAVNRLPDGLSGPVWIVMQGGNLVAAPVFGALAAASGRTRLARRLVLAGATTWLLAKVVKRWARRPGRRCC